jgi:hypothetical protein
MRRRGCNESDEHTATKLRTTGLNWRSYVPNWATVNVPHVRLFTVLYRFRERLRPGPLGRKGNTLFFVVAFVTGWRTVKPTFDVAHLAVMFRVVLVEDLSRDSVVKRRWTPLFMAVVADAT